MYGMLSKHGADINIKEYICFLNTPHDTISDMLNAPHDTISDMSMSVLFVQTPYMISKWNMPSLSYFEILLTL